MNAETIGWIAASLALFGYVLAQAMYSWDLYQVRRVHARFPMFAARDRVVRLVAEGYMKESDPAWAIVYTGTNIWLNPERNYSVWHEIISYMRREKQMQSNPEIARRSKKVEKILVERAAEFPAFHEVIMQIDNARRVIMRSCMHWWDRCAISVLLLTTYVLRLVLRPLAPRRRNSDQPAGREARAPIVRLRPRDVYKVLDNSTQPKPDIRTSVEDLIAWSAKFTNNREHHVIAN